MVANGSHGCQRSPDTRVGRDGAGVRCPPVGAREAEEFGAWRWRERVIDPVGAGQRQSVWRKDSAAAHVFIRCTVVRPGRTTVYSTDQCVFTTPTPAQMSTRGQDGSPDGPDVQVISEIARQTLLYSVLPARAHSASGGHSRVLELKDANARLPAVLSLVFLRHNQGADAVQMVAARGSDDVARLHMLRPLAAAEISLRLLPERLADRDAGEEVLALARLVHDDGHATCRQHPANGGKQRINNGCGVGASCRQNHVVSFAIRQGPQTFLRRRVRPDAVLAGDDECRREQRPIPRTVFINQLN